MGYSTVLVGTDGSESSYKAVDRAAEVAKGAGATLVLVCAYHPLPQREQEQARQALGSEGYKVTGSHPAEDVLADARCRVEAVGLKSIDTMAVEGDPVDVIMEAITSRDADLVVIGNRGLNSLAGRLLGSVPANISHRAPCDVLIVHTTGKSRR